MRATELTRVELRHGTSRMNVLVDANPLLKVGNTVTLKEDPNRYWWIDAVHETLQRADIKVGWNNNI